jgi:NAD(P)H-dependent FMN reductase
LETLAEKICTADAFVLVTGEYNWGVQPGLKNLTDHFLEAWFGRPGGYFQRFGEPTGDGGAALVKAIPGLC